MESGSTEKFLGAEGRATVTDELDRRVVLDLSIAC